MSVKHSDLIAIANHGLAEKLDRRFQKKQASQDSNRKTDVGTISSFKQDIWKAVYTLNILRYALGVIFLIAFAAPSVNSKWNLVGQLNHPKLFFFITIALLISGVVFSYFSRQKNISFNTF